MNRIQSLLLAASTTLLVMPLTAATIVLSVSPVNGVVETDVTPANAEYVSWSQTIEYANVSIRPYLSSLADVDVEFSAYLTTSIGPGTTQSGNEVASQNFFMPANNPAGYVTLFSGLDLPANQYYLVLSVDSPGGAVAWEGGAPSANPPPILPTAVIHTAPGVSPRGEGVEETISIAGYVPAFDFSTSASHPLLFQVTSDTPEPSTVTLIIIGFLGLIGRLAHRSGAPSRNARGCQQAAFAK